MSRFLVQLLLPVADDHGRKYPAPFWDSLKTRLADAFGGVTAYTRAPAEGIWAPDAGTARDTIFLVEVMTDRIDEGWWSDLRRGLEHDLRQEEIVIRALPFTRL